MQKPRREQYRVTITRPEGILVSDVRRWVAAYLHEKGVQGAKVELVQKMNRAWWRRWFGG